jgi:hypothetical protein
MTIVVVVFDIDFHVIIAIAPNGFAVILDALASGKSVRLLVWHDQTIDRLIDCGAGVLSNELV